MQNEPIYPNLVIAGAPKCGTSSLFFWLAAHPEVCGSRKKETYFLADQVSRHNEGLNMIENGLESYSKCFPHFQGEKIRVEATPPYIYMERPMRVLADLPSEPRVIFVLRSPAGRLYSHYRFNRYRLKNIDMSFGEYLDFDNNKLHWRNYVADTRYVDYLSTWLEHLGRERIIVLQMESMQADKVKFMKDLAQQLGIDPSFYDHFGFLQRNESKAMKKKWIHQLGLRIQPLIPVSLQEKLVPLYLKLNAGSAPEPSQEEKDLIEKTRQDFRSVNDELKSLFPEIDLSLW